VEFGRTISHGCWIPDPLPIQKFKKQSASEINSMFEWRQDFVSIRVHSWFNLRRT
jgi:hypothetical protein